MEFIKTLGELRKLYGRVGEAANRKVSDHLTPLYSQWIVASKFCVISTVGKNGTDGSPRGEDGPVVRIVDKKPSKCLIGVVTIASIVYET